MKSLLFRLVLLSAVLAAALPGAAVFASDTPATGTQSTLALGLKVEHAAAEPNEVEPVAIWSFIVILLLAGLGGVFYLLKRRMGGFPSNPAWVAPITIMRSKDFPDENSYSDAPAHDAHH